MITNYIPQQRMLTDTIYRLLTCRSVVEIKNYLETKGIPWQYLRGGNEDWEEVEEEQDEDDFGDGDIESIISDLFKSSINQGKTNDKKDTTIQTETEDSKKKKPAK